MAQSMGQGGHLHSLPPPWLLVQGVIEFFCLWLDSILTHSITDIDIPRLVADDGDLRDVRVPRILP